MINDTEKINKEDIDMFKVHLHFLCNYKNNTDHR